MFEAGPDQPEMVEAMLERLPRNPDAEITHICEVGQAKAARLVKLAKNHLLLRTMHRAPGADAAFHGPPDPGIKLGVPAAHLFENRHRPQAWCRLEKGDDLTVENISQRVWPAALTRPVLLGREHRIPGKPIARCRAETRLRGRGRNAMALSKLHE
jgi:hypothetical protein